MWHIQQAAYSKVHADFIVIVIDHASRFKVGPLAGTEAHGSATKRRAAGTFASFLKGGQITGTTRP
jgi:hypothetical protein